ncbi:MAG: YggT family protein [Gammaproteobacteria bacterium]|nr:YggT family protein [Gammaproteobacteria bacterium]MYF54080.1 YggT family protein [Gammaproteobacteria bacterium]MYK43075.1 YggT family protein [Gammaproteobacteria bacterium]
MTEILSFLFGCVMLVVLLRFLVQLTGVNFYNPIANAIVKLTNPILRPVRKLLPSYERWDFASLATVFVISIAIKLIPQLFTEVAIGATLLNGVLEAFKVAIWVFIITLACSVIMSWIAPSTYSPINEFTRQISDFFLRPLRRFLPTIEGFDFSPMLAMFICIFLLRFVIPNLMQSV